MAKWSTAMATLVRSMPTWGALVIQSRIGDAASGTLDPFLPFIHLQGQSKQVSAGRRLALWQLTSQ